MKKRFISKIKTNIDLTAVDLFGDISEIRLKLNEIINYINLEIGEKDEK